jgi:hypothetical protein
LTGFAIVTTIQAPTTSLVALANAATRDGMRTLAIGDRKTPATEWPDSVDFFSLASQRECGFTLTQQLPENHYARKNIGYLLAIKQGAELIFDTDDDNAPLSSWQRRTLEIQASHCPEGGWVNAYRWFSDARIWPRGLPLDKTGQTKPTAPLGDPTNVHAPIQQGLANGSPDVDAIWRLLMDREITFSSGNSVLLPPGSWCPFNSQSTWWFPQAYALLYLPSFVSFRMTDIWRSFIAQRCLWALGHGVVFHGPEMFQDRNPHNLLRDFEQEIPGYLGNARIAEILEVLPLSPGQSKVGYNLRLCYEALIAEGIVPAQEMPLVECWLHDLGENTA